MITLDDDAWRAVRHVARDVGLDVRADYSGRGMLGRTCLALTGDGLRDLVRFVQAVALDLRESDDYVLEDLEVELPGVRSDQLGHGVVYYWPDVEVDVGA